MIEKTAQEREAAKNLCEHEKQILKDTLHNRDKINSIYNQPNHDHPMTFTIAGDALPQSIESNSS